MADDRGDDREIVDAIALIADALIQGGTETKFVEIGITSWQCDRNRGGLVTPASKAIAG